VSKIIIFPVDRSTKGFTKLRDVKAFIEEHKDSKDSLVVQINPAGAGDAFADYLESAGFRVRRVS
jgi:hypothetical protein